MHKAPANNNKQSAKKLSFSNQKTRTKTPLCVFSLCVFPIKNYLNQIYWYKGEYQERKATTQLKVIALIKIKMPAM